MSIYRLLQPALFQLDPETAHNLTLSALSRAPCLMPKLSVKDNPVQLMGLNFKNRLGLGAGLDKNGVAIEAFQRLGFGHLELGTVTPKPQAGNPKPRLFRLPEHQAIINRMGFNNDGVEALIERVKKAHRETIIGINLGKNKDTPNEEALSDYLLGFQHAQTVADYITINISSPNTAGLRDLQAGEALRGLLSGLKSAQKSASRYVPIVVKIAPDNDTEGLHQLIDALGEHEIDGVITTNTTLDKTAVASHRYGNEQGGLSGQPLFERSLKITAEVRKALPNIALFAVGGVFSRADYQAKLDAGADVVQIYSGLIYRGWDLVREILA